MNYIIGLMIVAILYLLYSNRLQKVRTTRAIHAIGKFEERIKNHFESVINHVATIKSAIQMMQSGIIEKNLQESLGQQVSVQKVSAEDPQDKIVLLGELIPPE